MDRTGTADGLPHIRLIYTSVPRQRMLAGALAQLLAKSRIKNNARNITGVLLFVDGRFMQVLEGPAEPVLKLFEKIQADPRHTDVVERVCEHIDARLFSSWSMGYCSEEALPPNVRTALTTYMRNTGDALAPAEEHDGRTPVSGLITDVPEDEVWQSLAACL